MWYPIVCDENMTQGEYTVSAAGVFAPYDAKVLRRLGRNGLRRR